MTHFQMVAAAVLGTIATARLTRLIVFDTYPPVAWVRNKWHSWFPPEDEPNGSAWSKLVDCGYCAAPYFAAAIFAWGYFTDWQSAWWFFCGWLSAAYAAAIIVANDGDD